MMSSSFTVAGGEFHIGAGRLSSISHSSGHLTIPTRRWGLIPGFQPEASLVAGGTLIRPAFAGITLTLVFAALLTDLKPQA